MHQQLHRASYENTDGLPIAILEDGRYDQHTEWVIRMGGPSTILQAFTFQKMQVSLQLWFVFYQSCHTRCVYSLANMLSFVTIHPAKSR
jgi:hypothetical protein